MHCFFFVCEVVQLFLFERYASLALLFQIRGEAQAFAIEAKARAEAEQMSKKADAWRDYQEAAMVDMLLETLPKVCIAFGLQPFFHQVVKGLLLCYLFAGIRWLLKFLHH